MTEKISFLVEFPYLYRSSTTSEDVPYTCPYGSEEKFLEKFGMNYIGISDLHSSFKKAEKFFEIPFKKKLPILKIDEKLKKEWKKESKYFKKEYNAIKLDLKTSFGPNNTYYFLWIDKRKEWICIEHSFNWSFEMGKFNQCMLGPFSVENSLENLITQISNNMINKN